MRGRGAEGGGRGAEGGAGRGAGGGTRGLGRDVRGARGRGAVGGVRGGVAGKYSECFKIFYRQDILSLKRRMSTKNY